MLPLEERDPDRQRVLARVVDDRERPGELVPAGEEREDGDDCERRARKRDDQPPEARPRAATVDDHRFLELARDVLEEAAQQKRVQREVAAGVEHNEPPKRVEQQQLLREQELRDEHHHPRHHQADEDQHEGNRAPRELEPRERVGHHRRERHRSDRRQYRDDDRVEEVMAELIRAPRVRVVRRGRVLREEPDRDLQHELVRLERSREHVRERQDHHGRARNEKPEPCAGNGARPPDAADDHQTDASSGRRNNRSWPTASTKTMGVRMKLSADPYPKSRYENAQRYMYVSSTCVSSSGPPFVIRKTEMKTLKLPMTSITVTKATTGRIAGRETARKRAQALAPSTADASFSSTGTP